jgi:hypothetical protein
MCLLWGRNWVFIFQKTPFFVVTAMKTQIFHYFIYTFPSFSLRPILHSEWEEVSLPAPCFSCYLQLTLLLALWFPSPWRWTRNLLLTHRFLQDPHGVTSQKTPFFIVTAVKTSNLTITNNTRHNSPCPTFPICTWEESLLEPTGMMNIYIVKWLKWIETEFHLFIWCIENYDPIVQVNAVDLLLYTVHDNSSQCAVFASLCLVKALPL